MAARTGVTASADYEQKVAARLRGCLAERRISKHQLAQMLGLTDFWVGRRTNGQTAITVGELIFIAQALDEPIERFLPEDFVRQELARVGATRTRSSTDRASDYGSEFGRFGQVLTLGDAA